MVHGPPDTQVTLTLKDCSAPTHIGPSAQDVHLNRCQDICVQGRALEEADGVSPGTP